MLSKIMRWKWKAVQINYWSLIAAQRFHSKIQSPRGKIVSFRKVSRNSTAKTSWRKSEKYGQSEKLKKASNRREESVNSRIGFQ
jgi:hypothetical protein